VKVRRYIMGWFTVTMSCAASLSLAGNATPAKPPAPKYERTVIALVDALKDQNRDARAAAAQALGVLQRKDKIGMLTSLLAKDPADEVKIAAIAALGEIGDPSTEMSVRPFLSSRKEAFRFAALNAMMAMQVSEAPALLRASSKDTDESLRLASVMWMGRTGGKEAVPTLIELLGDASLRIRHNALLAMAQVWTRLGGEATMASQVADMLADAEPMLRAGACEALGSLPDEKALPLLTRSLADKHYLVRRSAAAAIGSSPLGRETRTTGATSQLILLLTDGDHTVRGASATALGQFTPPAAIDPLGLRLEDPTPEVRHASAESLSRYAAKDALGTVARVLLGSKIVESRREAAWVLTKWTDPVIGDTAFEALKDTDVFVRARALCALRQVGDERAVPHALGVLAWTPFRSPQYFDEMAEAYLVAQRWPDARFVPLLIPRLNVGVDWIRLSAADGGPPTSYSDVLAAIVASGYFKHPELTALLKKITAVEPLAEPAKEAYARATDQPYTPPPPRVSPPEPWSFFITCRDE
jgi:HEAT repeat protein